MRLINNTQLYDENDMIIYDIEGNTTSFFNVVKEMFDKNRQ